jgi:hypothetical protein
MSKTVVRHVHESMETEVPAIMIASSVFSVTDQLKTAVVTENVGFSHRFHCTLNECNLLSIVGRSTNKRLGVTMHKENLLEGS